MVNALWITLIGMGLVFLAILMLWGLMALLVRLTQEKAPVEDSQPAADNLPAAEHQPAADNLPAESAEPLPAPDRNLRRRAAAAGVAAALALQQSNRQPAAPALELGAWQSVQRASQLGQRNGFSRKVRG